MEVSDLSMPSCMHRPAARQTAPPAASAGHTGATGAQHIPAARSGNYITHTGANAFQRCLKATAEARAKGSSSPVAAPHDAVEPQDDAAQPAVQGMAWGARAGHISHTRDLHIGASGSMRQRANRGYRNSSINSSLEASMASLLGNGNDDGAPKAQSAGGGGTSSVDVRQGRGLSMASTVSAAPSSARISAFDGLQLKVRPAGSGGGGDSLAGRSTSDSVPSLARLGVSNASERLKRLKTQRERSARIARQLRDAHWKEKPIEVVGGSVPAVIGHRDRRQG